MQSVRRMWFSPRAIGIHLAGVAAVVACVALCDWQVHRAVGGNSLSWAYVFEWPLFACCAVYLWWDLIRHPEKRPPIARSMGRRSRAADASPGPIGAAVATGTLGPGDDRNKRPVSSTALALDSFEITEEDEEEDPELAAYNRYLAELNTNGRQKRW